MNELDQYVKRELKAKCYVRYCDDFAIVSDSRQYLERCVEDMKHFCTIRLLLELHPHKIVIRKINQGVDFLGYVLFVKVKKLRCRSSGCFGIDLENPT